MVSAILMQSATLHQFHSTTTDLLSIASPSALWTTQPPINRSRQAPFTQTGSGAWNLTLSARPAFCFYQPFLPWLPRFSPIDPDPNAGCPTRQEPIPTLRSSDGCLTLRPTKSARRFAPFAEDCLSDHCRLPTLTSNSSLNVYSQLLTP